MKLVFLDIDGVLNSRDWLYSTEQQRLEVEYQGNEHLMINGEAVARLNRILAASGAKIVVSSSWRCGHKLPRLREILKAAGVEGEVVGATPRYVELPNDEPAQRGHEIQVWLDRNGGKGREEPNFGWPAPFVILDDDRDMVHLMPRLVKTTFAAGLLDEHVTQALAMLAGV